MSWLKAVCSQELHALLLLDQLVGRYPDCIRENQIVETLLWNQHRKASAGVCAILSHRQRGQIAALPECVFQSLGEDMVLLAALLGDQRLDGALQRRLVVLSRGANQMDEEICACHVLSMTRAAERSA